MTADNDDDDGEDGEDDEKPFRRTNTSAYYRSIERKRKRYTPTAEELADDQEIKGSDDDDYDNVNHGHSDDSDDRIKSNIS